MYRSNWDGLSTHVQRGWYDVAAAEAALLDQVENRYLSEYQRLRKDMATMVKRKHYTDAIKSLSMCQNQIETLMIELKRWNPTSMIAQDASTVLGLLETMIMANPDMQTTDWKADAKAKADEAEEKRCAVVQAAMWKDEPSYSDGWEGRGDYITGASWNGVREYVRQQREARGSTSSPDTPLGSNGGKP
jgi:hypothetical protein